MTKTLLPFLVLISMSDTPYAQAAWKTTTSEDIFTSEKTAELKGGIRDHNQILVFNCTKNKFSMSEVEHNQNPTAAQKKLTYKTLVKVEDNNPIVFSTTLSRRNPDFIQLKTDDEEKIKTLLNQLKDQKSGRDFLIGNIDKNGNHVSSASGSVSFAKKAINEFIAACNIEM